MGNISLQVFLGGTCATRGAGVLVHTVDFVGDSGTLTCAGGNVVLTEEVVPYLPSAANTTLPDLEYGAYDAYHLTYDGTCSFAVTFFFDNICFDADEGFYVLYGSDGTPVTSTFIPSASPVTLSPTASPVSSAPSLSPSTPSSDTPAFCEPEPGLSVDECENRRGPCVEAGVLMKWTGRGTVMPVRQVGSRRCQKMRMQDGGCQCRGYCAYLSKRACNSDPMCVWGKGTPSDPRLEGLVLCARGKKAKQFKGECYVKGSSVPAMPLELCSVATNDPLVV